MICDEQQPSQGLKDLFMILIERLSKICGVLWEKQIQLESPHYVFFTRLLLGEQLSEAYIYNQLRLTAIPRWPQLKLLVVELEQQDWSGHLHEIRAAAVRINRGACYYFPYKQDLLVLCYAEDGDSELSHRKSADQLDKLVYQPFGLSCGVSQIFEDITDIDMAYKQAKVILGLKNTIQSELFATGERFSKGVYLFEEGLLYYLVSHAGNDERFLDFCFSHCLVEKIYREDQRNGTNNVALFWFYLYHERNATLVAKRLYVHRNTVLYQINKIQQRFDFDLSVPTAREKMLLDFKMFFLRMSHDSLEDIFDEDLAEEEAR
jgi:sugar diacid utilization regulator